MHVTLSTLTTPLTLRLYTLRASLLKIAYRKLGYWKANRLFLDNFPDYLRRVEVHTPISCGDLDNDWFAVSHRRYTIEQIFFVNALEAKKARIVLLLGIVKPIYIFRTTASRDYGGCVRLFEEFSLQYSNYCHKKHWVFS